MTSTHGNLRVFLDISYKIGYTTNRKGAGCKGQFPSAK
jgi:hypothetical protein